MSFEGFGPAACSWFGGLEADNSKTYFQNTKDVFDEHVKAPMQALLADMQSKYGGEAKLFRQHRDVRFSKDKSPYKTAAYGGVYDPAHVMGWYVAIDARGFYAGRGVYSLEPDDLGKFRDAVAAEGGADLAKAVTAAEATGVEISGDALKTAPRGYDKAHPRVDLLRRKNIVVGQRITATEVAGDRPWTHALSVWDRVQPISDWMDQALR